MNVSVKPKRGPGFWKFNNSLLEDKNYTKLISEKLVEKKREYNNISDKRVLWDIIKYEIQTCTISYAKKKAKVRKELEQELLQSCDSLYIKLCEDQLTESERVDYMRCKSVLEDLNQYKERGAHIRSQAEQIEKDEKSNKYFYNKEKASYCKKTVDTLVVDGADVTKPDEILSEFNKFYTKLYSNNEPNIKGNEFQDILQVEGLIKLNHEDIQFCDIPITSEECKQVIW